MIDNIWTASSRVFNFSFEVKFLKKKKKKKKRWKNISHIFTVVISYSRTRFSRILFPIRLLATRKIYIRFGKWKGGSICCVWIVGAGHQTFLKLMHLGLN